MFKFIVVLAFISFALCEPNVRFVNQIEGSSLVIYSDKLTTISLPYEAVTPYYDISTGSLSITNVLDASGNSLTNGNPILLSFDSFATVALVHTGGKFTLVMLNESSSVPMTDETQAYVRMIDLAEAVQYVSLASVAGSITSYTGFLVATPFKSVDPTATQFRIFESTAGTYNSPLVTLPVTLSAGKAYTVFFFTPQSGATATLAYDHDVSGAINPSTSTSSDASSASLTTSQVIGGNNVENSANSISYAAVAVVVAFCSILLI
jgi:hypothetical protein